MEGAADGGQNKGRGGLKGRNASWPHSQLLGFQRALGLVGKAFKIALAGRLSLGRFLADLGQR